MSLVCLETFDGCLFVFCGMVGSVGDDGVGEGRFSVDGYY